MNVEGLLLNTIRDLLFADKEDYGEIYLIGGYIRDSLLNTQSKDLDFSVNRNSIKAAKKIADYFGGDFYILDEMRKTARALVVFDQDQVIIDISELNGKTIDEDLLKRDFTINAMAVNLSNTNNLIDPLNGKSDLFDRRLRTCNDNSFQSDPIRTLRAVRFIQQYSLNYDQNLENNLRIESRNLHEVSGERIRQELNHIFSLPKIEESIHKFVDFGLFDHLFPELVCLKEIPPNPPYVYDAFTHTIRATGLVQDTFQIALMRKNMFQYPDGYTQLIKKYQLRILEFLNDFEKRRLSLLPMIVFAALYHDSGKVIVTPKKVNLNYIFPKHAEKSAEIVRTRVKNLAYSRFETDFISSVVCHHMADELKTTAIAVNPNRNIYHFFSKTNSSGIVVCFLHLADIIATYEMTLHPTRWSQALKSVDILLDGWFNHYSEFISPPKLVDGTEIMEKFGFEQGKEIGNILNLLREAQVSKKVTDRESALLFIQEWIRDQENVA